jgi:hypothetical protein
LAIVVGFLLFMGWLSSLCDPGARPIFFFVVLDPIDVLAGCGIVILALGSGLAMYPKLGGFLVIGPLLALVLWATWIIFTHYVVPYYSQCFTPVH